MRRVEPLPCPFCGSPGVWLEEEDGVSPGIYCLDEMCNVSPYAEGEDFDEAVAAWNQRAPAA